MTQADYILFQAFQQSNALTRASLEAERQAQRAASSFDCDYGLPMSTDDQPFDHELETLIDRIKTQTAKELA